MLKIIDDQPILPQSEVYSITHLANFQYIYYKLYRITTQEPIIQETYGTYANGTFCKEDKQMTAFERRRNLHGKKHFKTTTIIRDIRSLETYRNYT